MDYYDKTAKSQDQMAIASQLHKKNETNVSTSRNLESNDNISGTERSQEPRFGFTNVGGTGAVCNKIFSSIIFSHIRVLIIIFSGLWNVPIRPGKSGFGWFDLRCSYWRGNNFNYS